MKAGRLLPGEIFRTPNQLFCKLGKPIDNTSPIITYNFMIIGGFDAGKFVNIPDDTAGEVYVADTGTNLPFFKAA